MKKLNKNFRLAEGTTGVNEGSRSGLLLHKFPSLARLCRANNPVNCLVFLFESYARVIEKGQGGSVPVRGKHTTTETIPSLFVRGSQRWRASETYAGGRGFKKAAFT
ncbi:hypothetical protein IJ579_07365, partial [bacterium]|nr:hypothetical protein [bacterium]